MSKIFYTALLNVDIIFLEKLEISSAIPVYKIKMI